MNEERVDSSDGLGEGGCFVLFYFRAEFSVQCEEVVKPSACIKVEG